jgi:hypothetical protein
MVLTPGEDWDRRNMAAADKCLARKPARMPGARPPTSAPPRCGRSPWGRPRPSSKSTSAWQNARHRPLGLWHLLRQPDRWRCGVWPRVLREPGQPGSVWLHWQDCRPIAWGLLAVGTPALGLEADPRRHAAAARALPDRDGLAAPSSLSLGWKGWRRARFSEKGRISWRPPQSNDRHPI